MNSIKQEFDANEYNYRVSLPRPVRVMKSKIKKWLALLLSVTAIIIVLGVYYYRTHPLVFNESFFQHAHCIAGAGLSFRQYASEHGGRFPYSTNGYGNALVMINDGWDAIFTGPGYDTRVFERVRRTGEHAPESEFGRVYIQGLTDTNNPEIVLLFDKIPTPGGDHGHLFQRFLAPLCREVCLVDGDPTSNRIARRGWDS